MYPDIFALKSESEKSINDFILLIKEINDTLKIAALKKPIIILDNLLEKSPFIDIAIIGQFKAGKSSFINSLFGRQILPVGVTPVTTLITRLVYGETEKAIVRYADGLEKDISLNEISNYISELKNPVNEKNADYVELQLPELKEYRNLRLIDTPGVGSILKHNTDITEDWLPNAGISIMLVNSGIPLSEIDYQIIKETLEFCPDISIVLSKVDFLNKEQLKEVHDYTDKSIQQKFNKTLPILHYSIYSEKDKFNSEIKNKVLLPIANNFEKEFQNIIHHKIVTLAKSCISYLEIALKAAEHYDTERVALKHNILDEKLNSVYINNDLRIIIRNHKSKIREDNKEQLIEKYHNSRDVACNVSTNNFACNVSTNNFACNIFTKIENDFDRNFIHQKGNLYKYSRAFELWLNDALNSELSNIITIEADRLNKIIDDERIHITYYIESIRKKLNDNLKRVLNIQLPEIDLDLKTELIKTPDISVYWAFDTNIDSLWFLIPMPLFRKAFRKYFRSKIEPETEKNLYRLASVLSDEIDNIINSMYSKAIDYISGELSSVENMLSSDSNDTNKIKQYLAHIINNSESFKIN